MSNVNVNKENNIKLLKNYIQDLSFENPQDINENNSVNNNNNDIKIDMNVTFMPYEKNFFSLNLKYTLNCSSKQNHRTLFNIELDYFGFFEILEKNHNQKYLTKKGIKILFPFAKEIIENIIQNGGSVPIYLKEIDFELENT